MYIFVFEDGSIGKASKVTKDDLSMADGGYVDIISISGQQPTQYHDGEWYGINEYTAEV